MPTSNQQSHARKRSSTNKSTHPSPIIHKDRVALHADADHAPSSYLRDGILSLLLFLLLWEWLRPLPQLSDVSEIYIINPFLIVFALCLAIDWLKVPYLLGWLLKAFILIALIGYLFYPSIFPSFSWAMDFGLILFEDGMNAFHGNVEALSPQTRTLLFIIGWVLLIAVAQALLLQRQQGFWFVAATLVYLILLQVAMGTDTTQGIIRTLGCGMLLLALSNLPRIEQSFGIHSTGRGWPFSWLFLSGLAALVIFGIGWYGSKSPDAAVMKQIDWSALSEKWESKHLKEINLSKAAAKTGYSSDDSQLGGPLLPDESIVFTAQTEKLAYWRGESLSFYDGKGWSRKETELTSFKPDTSISDSAPFAQEVMWNKGAPNKQIFVSGNLASVDSLLTEKGKPISPETVLIDYNSGKVTLPEISDPVSYYKITSYSSEANPQTLSSDKAASPLSITNEYLQLPSNLPQAIRDLSERITANLDSNYDRISAIEHYLRSNYTYSLDKPTYPASGEDFVSHFLFVDRMGYCDYFSTSMVVMLRSIGIPARWVKGFAPGEVDIGGDDAVKKVTVRAMDAHSWVEVYFPSSGWVPFDPTPSFSGPTPLSPEGVLAGSYRHELTPASSADTSGKEQGVIQAWANKLSAMPAILAPIFNSAATFVKARWIALAIGIGLLLILTGFLLLWRRDKPSFLITRSLYKSNVNPKVRLMDRLWHKVFRSFGSKAPHLTLREYVSELQLPNGAQMQALIRFTHMYEALRYNEGGRVTYTKSEIAHAWKTIQTPEPIQPNPIKTD
jgi:transglutaminase-like putative cysteine protease